MAVKRPGFIDVWCGAIDALGQPSEAPLVVLAGDQAFVKERLIDAAAKGHGGEVETFVLRPGEGEAAGVRRLVDSWATATLFGGGRLLVVRSADKLIKGDGSKRIAELLSEGAPPHRLLLSVASFDGRTKLAKTIKKAGGLVSLPPMRDAPPPWHQGGAFLETDLNLWVVQEARLQGLTVSLAVAAKLTDRVGNEPGRLAQTLARLAILLEGRDALTAADIQRYVMRTSARLLTQYEDALRAGAVTEALSLVDRMSRDGVYDQFQKLVTGGLVAETVLRGLASSLAREVAAHDALGGAVGALSEQPWKRNKRDSEVLDTVLGRSPSRVFLERDLRRTDGPSARAGFDVALSALRGLRDGAGGNLHALTVRLASSLSQKSAARW